MSRYHYQCRRPNQAARETFPIDHLPTVEQVAQRLGTDYNQVIVFEHLSEAGRIRQVMKATATRDGYCKVYRIRDDGSHELIYETGKVSY